ncbi:MAG: hypothetical protein AMS21_09085 [Gemmatimonas sp. SG8_38_2]|nr:MAG: hypothetical protein AMS21_09085 [Gemmatimonas sp. SG8_38_2]
MDRKEMIRQYKETPRPAGVFVVRHRPSGRSLLGSSPDAPAMLNRIRAQLRMRGHPNKELQRDWNGGGADQFDFEVVDLLDEFEGPDLDVAAELEELEAVWREELGVEGAASY